MLSRTKKAALAIILPTALAIGFGASVFASPNPDSKTTICHFASHKYVKITVANPALPAHMAHGDVLPDEYGECP